ncbi:MAG TPA: trypsin-like peptidase domain-containing protein [Candidatus Hydrogenedentes bacterium]|nr:trypsin-like peptidase domain-containing protein [Candidatus Hydrogenedentota bacterium]
MKKSLFIGLTACLLSAMALAEYADYIYVPPPKSAVSKAALFPIPEADIARYLEQDLPERVLTSFMGRNEELQAETESPGLQVACGTAIGAEAGEVFGQGFYDRGYWNFLASVTSVDAYAVRLQVDVSRLQVGQQLYVIDPVSHRAFGPYPRTDGSNAIHWLPTIPGDTAVMLACSPQNLLPEIQLVAVSHFFVPLETPETKATVCPERIACETDVTPAEVSAGVAMLIIAEGFSQIQCTGALLNNPVTETLEPLMITANHCVEEDTAAEDIDVIWDYRTAACDDGTVPDLDELLHSTGAAVLVKDPVLDGAFLQLDSAPVGPYGRAWLGWDTSDVALNVPVHVMHHPRGKDMRISKAHVTDIDVTACLDFTCCPKVQQQIEVHYDEGITQGGSSGSPLLMTGNNYRVCGMLSNGNVHSCDTPASNMDNYASFKHFFPKIACHLTEDGSCEAPFTAPACCPCPAKLIYGAFSSTTDHLRTFRDRALMTNTPGRLLTKGYYAAAPALSSWVKKSTAARTLFRAAAAPAAAIGASLE